MLYAVFDVCMRVCVCMCVTRVCVQAHLCVIRVCVLAHIRVLRVCEFMCMHDARMVVCVYACAYTLF
jgi:hypothetical protein